MLHGRVLPSGPIYAPTAALSYHKVSSCLTDAAKGNDRSRIRSSSLVRRAVRSSNSSCKLRSALSRIDESSTTAESSERLVVPPFSKPAIAVLPKFCSRLLICGSVNGQAKLVELVKDGLIVTRMTLTDKVSW